MNVDLPINRETAKRFPESTFATPHNIVTDNRLTLGEKLGTLRRWANQIEAQLAATSEGMPTNGTSARDLRLLEDISGSIDELNKLTG